MKETKLDYKIIIRTQIKSFMKVIGKLNIPIFILKFDHSITLEPYAQIFSNENSNIMRGIIENPTFQKSIKVELNSTRYKKNNTVIISKFKDTPKYNHKTGKLVTRISKLFDIEYDKIHYLASVF